MTSGTAGSPAASSADEAVGFIQGISELALWVQDLPLAIEFYRDRLGFLLYDYTEGVNAFLRSGDLVLALFVPVVEGNTPIAQDYLKQYGGPRGSLYHIGFKVNRADLEAHAERLQREGIVVNGPVNFGTGRRSYFFENPDHHFIEMTDQ